MNKAITILACAAALFSANAPADAATGYFIVHGYSSPPEIVAGPFDSYTDCIRIKNAYGYDYTYHCDVRAY